MSLTVVPITSGARCALALPLVPRIRARIARPRRAHILGSRVAERAPRSRPVAMVGLLEAVAAAAVARCTATEAAAVVGAAGVVVAVVGAGVRLEEATTPKRT